MHTQIQNMLIQLKIMFPDFEEHVTHLGVVFKQENSMCAHICAMYQCRASYVLSCCKRKHCISQV